MIAAAAILILSATFASLMLRRRHFGTRVLIIGSGPLALQLVTEFDASRHMWHHVADIVDNSVGATPSLDPLAAAPFARLARIIDALRPDHIVVALADRRGRLPMRELLDATAHGVVVEDGVDCYERLTGKIAIEALTPSGVIASPAFRKSHFDLAVSHVLSLVIAAAALVVLSPLFALLALLVKLDSPGPVFFVHDRVGLRGRRFRLLKFGRCVRPTGRRRSGACDNGHRITRVGGWLRRHRPTSCRS
jgi:hypothetical protein